MRKEPPATRVAVVSHRLRAGGSALALALALAVPLCTTLHSASAAGSEAAPLALRAPAHAELKPDPQERIRLRPPVLTEERASHRPFQPPAPQPESAQLHAEGAAARSGGALLPPALIAHRRILPSPPAPGIAPQLPTPLSELAQNLETVPLAQSISGRPRLLSLPSFESEALGRIANTSRQGDIIFYSLDPELQRYAEQIVHRAPAEHAALVAMEPSTGRILAMADKSSLPHSASLHAGFPAASIFKVVTAAAAVEHAAVSPFARVPFHGGLYTLERWNYAPNSRKDRQVMSLADALGRSCNPVFSRVALQHLTPRVLGEYAEGFAFNRELGFDHDLTPSRAYVPNDDDFQFGRTAAGFGEVTLSPLHGAVLMSGLANKGVMMRPSLVDSVRDAYGQELYSATPTPLRRAVAPETAERLLEMMERTTTIGTSRREFANRRNSRLHNMRIPAKTGTLRGKDPVGLNQWFIAAAPMQDAQIAISVVTVDPVNGSGKAAHLARLLLERYFDGAS